MNNNKDVGSIHRPPMLDGTNYDYWKTRMIAFLRSIDDGRVYKSVLKGWTHPVQTKEGTTTIELKLEVDWSKTEDEEAAANSKALNAIFNGVDKNMFRLIHTCTTAKDAWEILKMKEEETISEFHMCVRDMANASFALGEPMTDEKLVRKILRSLPKKFDMKVTAIDEAQDISSVKVDELIGSLQTFEMSINDRSEKKNRSITFVSNMGKGSQNCGDANENLEEALALCCNSKTARDVKGLGYVSDSTPDDDKKVTHQFVPAKRKTEFHMSSQMPQHGVKHVHSQIPYAYPQAQKINKTGWKCHHCGRYGHIKPYCYRLHGFSKRSSAKFNSNELKKKKWKPKINTSALVAYTSLRASSKEDWYYDSGCSRHMTGVKNYLGDVKPHSTSYVTFGDGAQGKIKGSGKLVSSGSPELDDVLLVEGLAANLISISQLCDLDLDVTFCKTGCQVTDGNGEVVMRGARSKDNCFMWISQYKSMSSRCFVRPTFQTWI
ncbi:uncharacterized protein LOC130712533 [Lotus japonicus]|uniref:uncharacterized protein LOC130712533 n=1 Tax=Lotus japonicus TaxID=34305 RepID=UPI002589FA1D|nr:uncharacterized protein LOC130712533 [Lotus japonicus]